MSATLFSVRVGSNNLDSGGNVIQVFDVLNHPEYDSTTKDYDFSLLRLLVPVIFDGKITAAVKLPPANDPVDDGSEVFVSGWGDTQDFNDSNLELHAVIVNVINQRQCARSYAINKEVITNRMICASSSGKDSCQVRYQHFTKRLFDFCFQLSGRFG